ncbi:glycerate kinase [Nocardiopsis sp. RSe5-2]|uniref:Glycerate kinase n=1 Tax=Nocardiopsis endophytica TaxID=3018445 RepID=A0ABT4TZ32_9ACTN|nr:glycerate kinase [Nocardiopsis endophytica]MDA2809963.1 glycerate kinase [Nocardiopsis endophytica]
MAAARRVVVAPDKFKGSLTADGAGDALRLGLLDGAPGLDVLVRPLADGGEGSVAACLRAGFAARTVRVRGPLGDPVDARFALGGDTAVVEAAQACGLQLLGGDLAPLTASSAGLGDMVRHALDSGARRIVLAAGGSATLDGGAGMLSALGCELTDAAGTRLPAGAAALRSVAHLDTTGIDPRLRRVELVLAADVDAPLTGPTGAVAVFGAQKGAGPAEAALLEEALGALASVAPAPGAGPDPASLPGAGAAGGIGFGAYLLGARHVSGAAYFAELAGLPGDLAGASLVITGEGSLDAQTLAGKLPAVVAAHARSAGVPVVAAVGRCLLGSAEWRGAGFAAVHALIDRDPRCADDPGASAHALRLLGRELAAHATARERCRSAGRA